MKRVCHFFFVFFFFILISCSNFDNEISLDSNHQYEKEQFVFKTCADSLTSGSLKIDVPNVKYNQTITFVAKCSELGRISLSHGENHPYSNGKISIDNKNLYVYNSISELEGVYSHGLNFCDFIRVCIEQGEYTDALVKIFTNGGGILKI